MDIVYDYQSMADEQHRKAKENHRKEVKTNGRNA